MVLRNMRLAALALMLCLPAQGQAVGVADWITAAAYGEMHIVVGDDAAELELEAAKVFQQQWLASTGKEIGISTRAEKPLNVWLGTAAFTTGLVQAGPIAELGDEGFLIKTYTPTRRQEQDGAKRQLLIVGHTAEGTLHGVYEFFSRYLRTLWIAPGVVFSPPAMFTLPHIDFTYEPHFAYRETSYHNPRGQADRVDYRRGHKFPERFNAGPFGAHTYYLLLPPDKYFATHPEFYSEVEGERVAVLGKYWDSAVIRGQDDRKGQVCASNPDVAAAMVDELASIISGDPETTDPDWRRMRELVFWGLRERKVASVSQMDWFGNCQCASCKAVDEAGGAPSASSLLLANRVAKGIEARFPGQGYQIHTIAYLYTQQPPTSIRPQENVIVQLAGIGCDFGRPLTDPASPENAAFVSDLKGWSALTDKLYVWDYTINFDNGLRPHPNLHVLQSNLQIFDSYNVVGVFEQAWDPGSGVPGEFNDLRAYILGRCIWDPDYPWRQARDEFLRQYYGPAMGPIREYTELIASKVQNERIRLGCFQQSYWFDADLVEAAQALFEKALAMPLKEDQRKRVEQARLSVEYAALTCPPRLSVEGEKLVLSRPESLTLEEYLEKLAAWGHTREEQPEYAVVQSVVRECAGETPPRREELALVTLEDAENLLWVIPERSGAVIRWQNKTRGLELLRNVQNYGAGPGALEDWVVKTEGEPEGPASPAYRVVEQAADRVIIETDTATGLRLTRTMQLSKAPNGVRVKLEVNNPGDAPVAPDLKLHPEFFTQGIAAPELWIRRTGGWERVSEKVEQRYPYTAGVALPVGDATAMAFYVSSVNITLISEFDPAQVGRLLYFYNWEHQAQQVNLELIMPNAALQPGESRTLEALYRVINGRPDAA